MGISLVRSRAIVHASAVAGLLLASVMIVPAVARADYDPAADAYSMRNASTQVGARTWWNAGYTGQGVDVALIDSGVTPVEGLNGYNKLVYGPDLSFESQSNDLRNLDTFGHGTFMAGLIAGNDANGGVNPGARVYRGIAPNARIVSLKVATADGGTDVTQIIAAIDWVIQHRDDNGLDIRVLNLSYGTNSTQNYRIDPLAYAAERAWKAGIVVVVAAGNAGYQKGAGAECMSDPAYDPYLIAVGGVDTKGTTNPADDKVGSYSTTGSGTCKTPDFVTVGSHLQGLRVPGSFIDQAHPEGFLSDRYFRGSGTSEAAAVTSGAVALLLQKYPGLTPNEVKKFLERSAVRLTPPSGFRQGSGEIQLSRLLSKTPRSFTQQFNNATGTGSLEMARGTDHVGMDGVDLTGSQDIFGRTFDATAMARLEARARSWKGGIWNGSAWSGDGWTGTTWDSCSWSGSSWTGRSWSSVSWSGNTWDGRSWSGHSWTGRSWSGHSWTGRSWSGSGWE